MLRRGGGADGNDPLRFFTAAVNCTQLCYYGMRFDGMDDYWYEVPPYDGLRDPYYLKCLVGASATPNNGLRMQTPSQTDTNQLDPLVPQMNITDWLACMRIHLFTLLLLIIMYGIINVTY